MLSGPARDVDLGRNMAFDDAGFYAGLCAARAGRTLELGCGNGRILLALIAAGLPATGVDTSTPRLAAIKRTAAQRGLKDPAVCCMDLRALGFARVFHTVLCPCSIVTRLKTGDDFRRMSDGVHAALRPGGRLVVDVSVPRPLETELRDEIRPYPREALHAALRENGFAVEREWWDYADRPARPDPRFLTVMARPDL